VSRIAGVLAVAVFGTLLSGVFQSALTYRLDSLALPPVVRAQIETQRSKLAAAETDDARGRKAIEEAFIVGYRTVLWVAVGLALASSLSAAALIATEQRSGIAKPVSPGRKFGFTDLWMGAPASWPPAIPRAQFVMSCVLPLSRIGM